MDLCDYKDAFGAPGTGAHSYRIFDIAIVDVLATVGLSIVAAWIFSVSFFVIFLILIITSVILHRTFCVRTTVDKWLFD
jgi:hypothetical protein